MNDKEFFDFLQKSRDFEDELNQDRAAIQEYIDRLKRYAVESHGTCEKWLTFLAKKSPVRAKALEVLERRLYSK